MSVSSSSGFDFSDQAWSNKLRLTWGGTGPSRLFSGHVPESQSKELHLGPMRKMKTLSVRELPLPRKLLSALLGLG